MWAGFGAGLLKEEAHCAGTKASVMGKGGFTGEWRVGLGVSKVGSECWCCTGFCRWLCAYAEGWGREMVPASSFVPGDCLSMNAASLGYALR